MQEETYIMIDKVSAAASRMDNKCWEIFLNKEILAPILRETVEEYRNLNDKEIIALIDQGSISRADSVSDFPAKMTVDQTDTDMKSVTDKLIMYDIRFKVALPESRTTKLNFHLLIDIEPQGKYYLKYPLIKRAVYYVAREISAQLGELTEETDYGILQKAYSIWLCYDPQIPKRLKNTISRYKFTKEDLLGRSDEDREDYDLMEIVMVRLDRNLQSDSAIIDFLQGVFNFDRKKIEKQIGTLDESLSKEVDSMSGLGMIIYEDGKAEGKAELLVKYVEKYMKKHEMTAEEACMELDESFEEYKAAVELLSIKA